MPWELRPGSGSLFRNDKKEQPNHADWRGELMMPDGTTYWLSGWTKTGRSGEFLSLSVKPKPDKAPDVTVPLRKPKQHGLPILPPVSGGVSDLDDDPIPF